MSSTPDIDTLSIGYSNYKHCLIWNGMPSKEPYLSSKIAKKLLMRSKAWMIRNCYEWDCGQDTNFWEVICDTLHNIEDYPSRVRTYIRKALKECTYRIISVEELIKFKGYDVYCKSFTRYINISAGPINLDKWEKSIRNSDYEIWGAFSIEDKSLIGFSLNNIIGESVSYSTLKALPELLNSKRTFYGLFYSMNQYYLSQNRFKYVTDGWRSITEHSNIQPFLEQKFLFRKAYCRMRLHYTSWFGMAVKILYPFRNLSILPLNVRNVLKFEEINREGG